MPRRTTASQERIYAAFWIMWIVAVVEAFLLNWVFAVVLIILGCLYNLYEADPNKTKRPSKSQV